MLLTSFLYLSHWHHNEAAIPCVGVLIEEALQLRCIEAVGHNQRALRHYC